MIKKYLMNIRLFDTATNTTAEMPVEMKTFYSDYLIDNAEPFLVHDQFAQKQNIPKNGGKTIEFRKYSSLPKCLTPLTEGVTPDGQKLTVTKVEATVSQYGGWVQLPDMLLLTAIDNNMVQATKLLGSQAGRTMDTITREVLNAGTNVWYAPAGETPVTTRANIAANSLLTVQLIMKVAAELKAQNAETIDGSYVAIVHPYVAYDLMSSDKWLDLVKYSKPEKAFNGEIGKIGNVRFVETSEAKIWEKSGAAHSGSDTTKVSVFSTIVLGANAYGTTNIEGGGLEHIIKQLGSAGTADPLNQRASAGWKATKTAVILSPEYMIRIESSSAFSTAASN